MNLMNVDFLIPEQICIEGNVENIHIKILEWPESIAVDHLGEALVEELGKVILEFDVHRIGELYAHEK